MGNLGFEVGYDCEPDRQSFILHASMGEYRVMCVVPFEYVTDHFGANSKNMDEVFRRNLPIIRKEAQRIYQERGLNTEGELILD